MNLNYSGLQTAAAIGLMQNTGMRAPVISAEFNKLSQLAAISQYHAILPLLNILPDPQILDTVTGLVDAEWQPGTAYDSGTLVLYQDQVWQAQDNIPEQEFFSAEPLWQPQPREQYVSLPVTWADYPPPDWLRDEMIVLTGTPATLSLDRLTLQFSTPPLKSQSTVVSLRLRKIFYTCCEQFPQLLDATPQQLTRYWGDGACITRAHARTQALFPQGAGAQVFANVLSQAAGYAQMSKQIITSAARSQFGLQNQAHAVATGGFSAVVGNSTDLLHKLGQAFSTAGDLVNLQRPGASFSAMQVLWKILSADRNFVGNIYDTLENLVFPDFETGIYMQINTDYLDLYVNNTDLLLRDTLVDQLIARAADERLSTSDVLDICEFLNVSVDPVQINKFSDLLNLQHYLGSATDSSSVYQALLAARPSSDPVDSLAQLLQEKVLLSEDAHPLPLAVALSELESLEDLPRLQDTVPVSNVEFQRLLSSFGQGGGVYGSLLAADCLGETNYLAVIQDLSVLLSRIQNLPETQTIITNYQQLLTALEEQDPTVAELTGAGELATWDQLIVAFKTLVDPLAQQLANWVANQGWADLLFNYNRLAETHNMSVFVSSAAPINYSTGYPASSVNAEIVRETQTAGTAQTVFTLTELSYQPGTDSLAVFISGVRQLIGVAFTETSDTVVTFTEPVPEGAEVLFEVTVLGNSQDATDPLAPLGTASSRSVILDFVRSLPLIAQDPDEFSAATIIQDCCENSVTGDLVKAVLREARNHAILAQAGVLNDAQASSSEALPVPVSAPGLIGGSQWSESNANQLTL